MSRIPCSYCGADCYHLDYQTVKAIIVGSTIEAPLFDQYQGRAIIVKSLDNNATEDLLFPSKGNTLNTEP